MSVVVVLVVVLVVVAEELMVIRVRASPTRFPDRHSFYHGGQQCVMPGGRLCEFSYKPYWAIIRRLIENHIIALNHHTTGHAFGNTPCRNNRKLIDVWKTSSESVNHSTLLIMRDLCAPPVTNILHEIHHYRHSNPNSVYVNLHIYRTIIVL